MKQYAYIAAVLIGLWGMVALAGQLRGCKHEQTAQDAIKNPATTEQVISHTETHTVTKPDGTTEIHTVVDTGSIHTSTPVIPSDGTESAKKSGYISLTTGYGDGNFITENYGVGAGWYLTNNLAVGARYDKVGGTDRYAVEITLSF